MSNKFTQSSQPPLISTRIGRAKSPKHIASPQQSFESACLPSIPWSGPRISRCLNKITIPIHVVWIWLSCIDNVITYSQIRSFWINAKLSHVHVASMFLCLFSKPLNRKRINWFTINMWKLLVDEYGIAAPLYFTFLKFQMLLFVVIFCVYGIFFIKEVHNTCNNFEKEICLTDTDLIREYKSACDLNTIYMFVAMDPFLTQLECSAQRDIDAGGSGFKMTYFSIAAFIVFLLNIMLPFFYEIIIRYKQIKYWDKEPTNHVSEHKKSVYVRHLPYKMTSQEIQ